MELIKKLGIRKNKTSDNYTSWGLFLCPYCLQEVEKTLSHGKIAKSCGCVKNELISESNKGKSRNKGKKRTEEQNRKQSERMKGLYKGEKNPMFGIISPNLGKKHTEETRQKIRNSNKGHIVSEETKQKIKETMLKNDTSKGGNNSNWQGGISFEEYGIEFNKELKQFILKRDNYTCQNLSCKIENPKRLDTHHIDYNKKNNDTSNLIILCINCHLITNNKNNRKYWTEFYQNIMIGKLMECIL